MGLETHEQPDQSWYAQQRAKNINPEMEEEAKRIDSFEMNDWSKQITQRPEELAQSGFYYRGLADIVHCYSCGVSIYAWEKNDDAMIEHKRWSHTGICAFLRNKISDSFDTVDR